MVREPPQGQELLEPEPLLPELEQGPLPELLLLEPALLPGLMMSFLLRLRHKHSHSL